MLLAFAASSLAQAPPPFPGDHRPPGPPPAPPDARFALALYCAPVCDDAILDILDAALADIPNRGGFPSHAARPLRIMGMAGTEWGMPDTSFVEMYGVDVHSPELVPASQEVLLAWFASPREEALTTLTTAHAAFAEAAAASSGWVEDLDTQKLYGLEAWKKLDPRGPITDWYVVDADAMDPADEAGDLRLVTRGLRRFGDFELIVEDVAPDDAGDVAFVVNGVAALRHTADELGAVMPVNTSELRGTATFREAARREDDPEEPVLRVSFEGELTTPTAFGPPPLGALPTPPRAPESLAQARLAAHARFDTAVRAAFAAGLPAGEVVAVKAPFRTSTGGSEYMWVEVRRWDGDIVVGELKNEPTDVPGLQKGATVTVRSPEVFDYVWVKVDGTKEGNTTAAFL